MDCQYLEDLHELFLLGALDRVTSAPLIEHLERGCPHCHERMREAVLVAYALSLNTRPVRPSPNLRARLHACQP